MTDPQFEGWPDRVVRVPLHPHKPGWLLVEVVDADAPHRPRRAAELTPAAARRLALVLLDQADAAERLGGVA